MHLAWVDLRQTPDPRAAAEEAVHAGVHGILTTDPLLLETLPPSVTRVGLVPHDHERSLADALAQHADVLVFEDEPGPDREIDEKPELGRWVTVQNVGS